MQGIYAVFSVVYIFLLGVVSCAVALGEVDRAWLFALLPPALWGAFWVGFAASHQRSGRK